MSPRDLWARYRKLCCVCDSIGVTLDVSRMKFPDDFLQRMAVNAPEIRRIPPKTPWESRYQAS